jgi:cyclic pyranopterin phosphate synthase
MSQKLSHIDEEGQARMVDVGHKPETIRTAVAKGSVLMLPETLRLILEGNIKKGDVLSTARIAGIMAAKKTSDLIPLCHPLPITHVEVDFSIVQEESRIDIEAAVRVTGKTGVEMEALTAVSAAALTIYDMAKAVDRGMRITDIHLASKQGGASGDYFSGE